ncbi:hypothetical protein [Streptomyces melanogenes]|uniref:hypothetical protein n=1 Tax=Streptomyces melanogenes TaxID=67326 RepID=UPI00378EBC53
MNRLRSPWARLRLLGHQRLRLALLVAALAATVLTWCTSLPAHAAPSPSPSPSSSAPATPPVDAGQQAPTPQEMEQIEQILREQGEKLTAAAKEEMLRQQTERLRKQLPNEGGVLGVFNVTDGGGMPISAYTVKGDTGGLTDWDLGLENFITELCFMITKWLIAFCCWLIAWALSFGLAKLLLAPVLSVAQSLHARVILEMGLPSLFLAVCALVCVARIFFGDRARGWGDAALSLVIAALTTTLLSSTPQLLLGPDDGAIAATRGLALEVASVILDASPQQHPEHGQSTTPASAAALSRPLTDALTDAFITKPAMLLQYGQVFDGPCAQAYSDTKLRQLAYDRQTTARANKFKKITGLARYLPGGNLVSSWYDTQIDMTRTWVVDHFGNPPMEVFEKKCVQGDVDAAKKASLDKVGGAFFLLVAAVIVTALIIGLAGSFLVAQCRIAWDAVRGEGALVAGTIPGAGRGVLWDWAASVVRSLAQMLWSVIALAVFIIIVQAVLDPAQDEWGRELTLRFLLLDIVCIGAIKKRKEITARTKQIGENLRTSLGSSRIGGTYGSPFAPTSAPPAGPKRHIGRSLARGVVRTGLAGLSLAQGNPLAAVGYAMPQSIGATALISRLNYQNRQHRPSARPAGRPQPQPAAAPAAPPSAPVPIPAPPTQPPASGPTRSTAGATLQRATRRAAQRSARRAAQRRARAQAQRRQVQTQPAASARQQQLRQRLNRRTRRHTASGTTTTTGGSQNTSANRRRNRRGRGNNGNNSSGTNP